MKFIAKLATLYLMWLSVCMAEDQVSVDQILIVAKPISVKFVSADESHAVAPNLYKLKIRDLKLIHGEKIKLPKRLILSIRANHGEVIPTYEQIFLVLDATDKNQFKVIAWDRVISMACIPKNAVDARYAEYYFTDKQGDDGVLCTFLRGYVSPPERP